MIDIITFDKIGCYLGSEEEGWELWIQPTRDLRILRFQIEESLYAFNLFVRTRDLNFADCYHAFEKSSYGVDSPIHSDNLKFFELADLMHSALIAETRVMKGFNESVPTVDKWVITTGPEFDQTLIDTLQLSSSGGIFEPSDIVILDEWVRCQLVESIKEFVDLAREEYYSSLESEK